MKINRFVFFCFFSVSVFAQDKEEPMSEIILDGNKPTIVFSEEKPLEEIQDHPLSSLQSSDDETVLSYLDSHPESTNIRLFEGNTVMHLAFERGHIDLINHLLDRKVSIDLVNKVGNPAWFKMGKMNDIVFFDRILSFLDSKKIQTQNKKKQNVAHIAALYSQNIFFDWLIEKGYKELLYVKDQDGRTPIHYLATNKNGIKWIIEHKKDIRFDLEDNSGASVSDLLVSNAYWFDVLPLKPMLTISAQKIINQRMNQFSS